jgi:hypothetical protein
MKVFSRATSSSLVTAVLMAVIIGSLCFSVGEGLRLTPFPLITEAQDAGAAADLSSATRSSLAKYGPLDVPTQNQKRGKRSIVDLASASRAQTQPVFVALVHSFAYEADDLNCLTLNAPPSDRAPPSQS